MPAKGKKRSAKKKQTTATNRVNRFIEEYLKDLNGAQAAVRAGYSKAAARIQAAKLLANEDIAKKVDEALKARSKRVEIEQDDVLKRLWSVATADAAELIRVKYICCRYCYGKGHRYQRTPREMEEYRADWEFELKKKSKDLGIDIGILAEEFDDQGGVGYDPRKPPRVDCPECFGEGERKVVLADTDSLSEQARLLYGGVKETQHGVQVVMEDRLASLVNVGRHLGMFKDKVEMTGKDGKPIAHEHALAQEIVDEVAGADTGIGPAIGRKARNDR